MEASHALATNPLIEAVRTALATSAAARDVAPHAYLVGGCVRDALLGRSVVDYDVCVEREGGARVLVEAIAASRPEAFTTARQLGAGYPIWQTSVRRELAGTSDVLAPFAGFEIEAADTQSEMFPDPTSRQRVARFGSLDEDCRRRDFTVNMLYAALADLEVRDPSRNGLADLRGRRLALHPDVSGAKIYADDPLRVLRLVRFHVQLDFSIDARAAADARECGPRLEILSGERVRDELVKMAESGRFEVALDWLERERMLPHLLPELVPMIDSPQDRRWHSEGNVWVHTLLVVKNAPKSRVLQFAALLHDAGKPATTTVDGDRIRHLGHELVSADIVETVMGRLKFPRKEIERVKKLVLLHLRGGDALAWRGSKAARKLLRDAGDEIADLLKLIEADSSSSLGPDGRPRLEHLPVLRAALERAQLVPLPSKPLLDGRAVMELLELEPGPEVSRAQAVVRELEDEFAERGEILDAATARLLLRERYAQPK